jgi:hypothetical protein
MVNGQLTQNQAEPKTYSKPSTPFVGMKPSRIPFLDNFNKQIQKLRSMDWQRLRVFSIRRWHGYDVSPIVELAKGDPHAAAFACNLRCPFTKAYLVEQLCGIRTNSYTCADLPVLRSLLIDVYINCASAMMMERERGAEPSNTAAYHSDT